MANKVEFGISQLHVGTYTVDSDGDVTMGTAYHQKGAVSFAPEEQADLQKFYADNIVYWSGFSGGSFEGDLEVALFDDKFKKDFLGYKNTSDGGLAVVKNAVKPNVYIAFEVEGDAESRRVIMYNATLGPIVREFNTIEENKEPTTEKISVNVMGDNGTGISMVSYKPDDAGYDDLFEDPPAPELASE